MKQKNPFLTLYIDNQKTIFSLFGVPFTKADLVLMGMASLSSIGIAAIITAIIYLFVG